MTDTDQKTQVKSAQDNLKNLSEMEEASEKGEQFLTKHFSKNLKLSRVFIKFKYSERATNFCEKRSNLRWRFRKNLWLSQSI